MTCTAERLINLSGGDQSATIEKDVLAAAKAHPRIADLAAKGRIETIWIEYWPDMCLSQPPPEPFAGGNGDPEGTDVANPTGISR